MLCSVTQQIGIEEEKVAKITRQIESDRQKRLLKVKAKSSKEEVCAKSYTIHSVSFNTLLTLLIA
jgi:hypothetical protein